jgi:hypothetical protein
MGVHRGANDPYTMEMYRWWFVEEDLLEKMFDILVPRFKDYPIDQPYTSIYRLPEVRMKSVVRQHNIFWSRFPIAVLELKGRYTKV